MLEILGTLLTGVLSGGATGLIGVLIQRYFDLQHKKQDIEITRLQLANTIELARMETDRAVRTGEQELEGKFAEADARIMAASFAHDAATYLAPHAQARKGWLGGLVTLMMAMVDFLRGILRPGMTAYLCALVTLMFFWARDLAERHGYHMTAEQAFHLVLQIVATILYCWTTATLWWFGTRPPKQGGAA
jgi:hypothetical protein